jgi:hypothetical protein
MRLSLRNFGIGSTQVPAGNDSRFLERAYKPDAALYETFSRYNTDGNQSCLESGRLFLCGLWLPTGLTITSITAHSRSTAASVPLNQWFAMFDNSRNKLAVTVDDTTTAWAANALKTLVLAATFTTTYSGIHYLGIMVTATTVPTLSGLGAPPAVGALTPKLQGGSTAALTNPASCPATAGEPAVFLTSRPYMYVS